MPGFIAVGYFLSTLFFNLILFILWVRLALRYLRISSLDPFCRLIYTLTNPILVPLCQLVRYKDQAKFRYDLPALVLLAVVELLKITLVCLITYHTTLPLVWTVFYLLADLIIQPCNLLFYAILVRIIMSYANPFWNHPLNDFLKVLTNPLLVFGGRLIPNISGFDFAPFITLIFLKMITLFIGAYLPVPLL